MYSKYTNQLISIARYKYFNIYKLICSKNLFLYLLLILYFLKV